MPPRKYLLRTAAIAAILAVVISIALTFAAGWLELSILAVMAACAITVALSVL